LCVGGVPYIVGKKLTRATIFLYTSFQSKVCTQNYEPPKWQESQLWEFRDSNLGVLGQNDIWVLVPWPGTKNTIRGKVMVSPKFGPWWILWVRVCSWWVRAWKVLQPHTNQLVVWFVQIHVNNWLLVILPNPHLGAPAYPSTPKCCELKNVHQLLILLLFSPWIHIWVYQRAWECVKLSPYILLWTCSLPCWKQL